MPKTITIPKSILKDGNLVVVGEKQFEKLTRENRELTLALRAVLAGEQALREGKTRPFSAFLRAKFPKYAQNL